MRRIIIWIVAVAAIAATVFFVVRPIPILVDTATVKVGPMMVRVEEDGKTRIRERYVVSTPLTGRMHRITLEVGDHVIADETVLVRMEPTDPTFLDPRAVAQAKARVRAAEKRLDAAKAELKRVDAALQFAETEMGRFRSMQKRNAVSASEFAEKELEFRQKTEEARAAGFAVDIAEYELELQKAALLLRDSNQDDNQEMELAIRSPITGRVLRLEQESSTVVNVGSPLMELGDPKDLEIIADVLSRDAARISAGDSVTLKHWGGEQDLRGRVRLVEPSGFTKISALGVEEQRVNVVIDFEDPPEKRKTLGDGFRVDCEIVVWESETVLQIPTSALFRVDGQWHVFKMHDRRAQLTEVTIDHNNGDTAEIVSGVAEGDIVITHPSDEVEDGALITER